MTAPAKDPLATLEAVQQQLNELVRATKRQRAKVLRKRGKQRVYSIGELPGREPSELDIARAKKLWRRL